MAEAGASPISDRRSSVMDAGSAVAGPVHSAANETLGGVVLAGRRRLRATLGGLLISAACLSLLMMFGFGAWMGGLQVWAWYHYRAARDAVERYHTPDAVKHLKSCLNVWPNDPDALVLAARSARRMEAFDEADDLLRRAQGKKRNYDPVLERLLLRAARGEIDEVEKTCHARVEQNDPDTDR